jgi:hypothetical protein
MLFHITQTHTPQTCPVGEGGSSSLFNAEQPGVRLVGRYGANAEHTLYYIVDAEDWQALQGFLLPGFKRATCTITPVNEEPVQH